MGSYTKTAQEENLEIREENIKKGGIFSDYNPTT